ncbi:unnamed protein product [Discula destructiva]
MPAPTQLAIATAAVQRLTKEEQQYHKELATQQARVAKLEKDIADNSPDLDENAPYSLTQEKQAVGETKAMFGHLHTRIADAVAKLEEKIALADTDPDTPAADLAKAKDAFAQGREALKATGE